MAEKIATISNIPLYKIDSTYVVILCAKTLHIPDIGTSIANFREMYPMVMIQGINPSHIFGERTHLRGIEDYFRGKQKKDQSC